VSSDEGRQQLSLELEVWDFALPEESHLKPNIHTDTEINVFPEDMELRYYQMIRKHRLAHHISHLQLRQFGSEFCVGSIARIGQHHTLGKKVSGLGHPNPAGCYGG
jgi:hypothetical protein